MILFFTLLGLHLLLSLPIVGYLLRHGIMHLFVHALDHHEIPGQLALGLLVLSFPVLLLVQLWFYAASVVLTLLLLWRSLGGAPDH